MKKLISQSKIEFVFAGLIFFAYLLTRLVRLDLIPIFTDEAIYLRWSQIMAGDASLRYLPLIDGKPPLFMWATSVVLKLLPSLDPLLALRLTSVGSGLFSLMGIIFTSYVFFKNKRISLLTALLYILTPFTFFYDRFGLADSLLAGFGIWSLGLGALLIKSLRLDVALILGTTIGLGLLTKTPALFFLLSLPLQLLNFAWKETNWKTNLLKTVGLFVLVFAISQAIFSVLRLFPLFHMISQKNLEFIVTPGEFFAQPSKYFSGNITTLVKWEFGYLTPLITLAIFLAINRDSLKQKLILLSIFVIHLLYMATFNKSIFPRFLLTFTPALLILSAVGLNEIISRFSKPAVTVMILALVLALPIYTDFKLLTDPPTAPIPDGDSNQYINAWPAGYGVKEIRDFLSTQSKIQPKITIGTEGTFGLMPYALQLYVKDYPNVEIKDYWPLPDKVPQALLDAASGHPTYFVIYQRQDVPQNWKMVEIASYRQGRGTDQLRLYQILSE